MTLETKLAEIRERADAATEGPWCFYLDDLWRGTAEALAAFNADPENVPWPFAEDETGHLFHGAPVRPADAEFIAHAREDAPRLLAAVEAVLKLADDKMANPEHIEFHGRHSIVSAYDVRRAIADALNGADRGKSPEQKLHGAAVLVANALQSAREDGTDPDDALRLGARMFLDAEEQQGRHYSCYSDVAGLAEDADCGCPDCTAGRCPDCGCGMTRYGSTDIIECRACGASVVRGADATGGANHHG